MDVLIVEDIAPTALWLKARVENVFNCSNIVTCNSVQSASESIQSNRFGFALVDINLPDGSGHSLIGLFKQHHRDAILVAVTIYDDDEHVFGAMRAGADGYLLKDLAPERFEEKLRRATRGEPALSPSIARKILRSLCPRNNPDAPGNAGSVGCAKPLTDRETEVLTLLAKGCTRVEIADFLELSPNTIAKYIKGIYRKLEVSSRAEVTVKACRMGLVATN